MMENYLTAEEAARYLKRTTSLVCKLCVHGKLVGAKKMGKKMWIIPEQSVFEYKPGPQGFAAMKARKLAEAEQLRKTINEARNTALQEVYVQ